MSVPLSRPDALSNLTGVTGTELPAATVELCLLDDVDQDGLDDLFVALWMEDRFRVTLDCSHLDWLGAVDVRTLARFASKFGFHGGFVALTHVNPRLRSLLQILRCADLLVPGGSANDPAAR